MLALLVALTFTEIMYDAPGTDAKHEWIEIRNDGEPVDIDGYKLYENGTNHGLKLTLGSSTLQGGEFAIIADDAATFLADFPGYTGALFDSAFSLSNSGETVTLRDASKNDVASVTYSADASSEGGKTLQLDGAVWIMGRPTPGGAYVFVEPPPPLPPEPEPEPIPEPEPPPPPPVTPQIAVVTPATTASETMVETPSSSEPTIQTARAEVLPEVAPPPPAPKPTVRVLGTASSSSAPMAQSSRDLGWLWIAGLVVVSIVSITLVLRYANG